MSVFNRRFPIQGFSATNHAGAAVIPAPPIPTSNFSGSATTNVTFTATATASTTRTASATTSIVFAATNTGTQLFTSAVGVPSAPESVGGNALSLSQGIYRPGLW